MARKKGFDPKTQWICEECGTAASGKNPPDDCGWCGHKYFDSLYDLLEEADKLEPTEA